MKKIFLSLCLILVANILFGQTAYIQVTGEPNLSVFLNNQFKGKTNVEFNGYIIEKVPAGKNIIKIVKEGYTPFEETITVKSGEVFAYKVKPFSKNTVYISEEGNTGQTEKKALLETGKLIVQSLPIEIKITIPDIEGINKKLKAKDKWIAENIATGNLEITFSFGEKVITKTIKIEKDRVTTVFVNMLNGDFVETTNEKLPYDNRQEAIAYINGILSTQERVYFKSLWCSSCKNKVDNKLLETRDIIYSSYAFTYSNQAKSYSLSEKTKLHSYEGYNGVHNDFNVETTYDYTDIRLNGEIIFEEKPCDNSVVSGNCLRLWIRSSVTSKSFPLKLPNTNYVEQLKKAILFLKELE